MWTWGHNVFHRTWSVVRLGIRPSPSGPCLEQAGTCYRPAHSLLSVNSLCRKGWTKSEYSSEITPAPFSSSDHRCHTWPSLSQFHADVKYLMTTMTWPQVEPGFEPGSSFPLTRMVPVLCHMRVRSLRILSYFLEVLYYGIESFLSDSYVLYVQLTFNKVNTILQQTFAHFVVTFTIWRHPLYTRIW